MRVSELAETMAVSPALQARVRAAIADADIAPLVAQARERADARRAIWEPRCDSGSILAEYQFQTMRELGPLVWDRVMQREGLAPS